MERGSLPTRQPDDGVTVEGFSDQTKMDEMDPMLWRTLEEDLLEMIITRLPLKDLVQSQILSKKWRSRFQSPSFQKEVSALSSRWGPSNFYHPLCVTENGLCGYDRSAQKWKDIGTLPNFPPDFRPTYTGSRWRLWGSDCVVMGTLVFSGHMFNDHLLHIFVTNIINKTINRCPPILFDVYWNYWEDNLVEVLGIHVHPVTYDHYKLVTYSYNIASVYDSKLKSWIEFEADLPRDWLRGGNSVYIEGVVYVPYRTRDGGGVSAFCTFDVENGQFGNIIPTEAILLPYGKLVAWRSELLIILFSGEEHINVDVTIHTVNLQTLEHTEMLKGPPEIFHGWMWAVPRAIIGDSDSIDLMLMPYRTHIYDPVTRDISLSLDLEGLSIDGRTLDERNCWLTCDVSKWLWSHSLADSRESGYDRDERIEVGRGSAFQPNLSPFLLA